MMRRGCLCVPRALMGVGCGSVMMMPSRLQSSDSKYIYRKMAEDRLASQPKVTRGKTTNEFDFPNQILKNRVWSTHQAGEHVTVYVDSGFYAWIVMDRAGSSANALGEQLLVDLHKAIDIVEGLVAEKKARLAILASAKKTFCVGADVEMMYPVTDKSQARLGPLAGHELLDRVEALPFPVVAAINGLALGGGLEMTLACHHRLMSSTAAVGLPECLLGLLPAAGGTVRLPRLIGVPTATQWILTSATVKAPKAKKAGAVDVVLDGEDRWNGENRFYNEVRSYVGRYIDKPLKPSKRKSVSWMDWFVEKTPIGRRILVNKSMEMLNKTTKGKYLGHYKALESILYASKHSAQAGFAREADLFGELLVTPEAKNMIGIYFLDEGMKKSESKTGVPKDKVPKVEKVGVIGAGVMGSGIVHFLANKGLNVAVKDMKQEAVDAGIGRVRDEFASAVKRKRLDEAGMKKKMALVTGGTTDEVFHGVDVIIEAAVEVMSVKKKIIQELEADGVVSGKNIFATNTSSLSLTEMQSVSKYPENIVGMHFFNPVKRMPLVEVIKGKNTSAEATAAIFNLALKIGKKPIIVNDAPGFIVNRILGAYMAEAGRLAIVDKADPAIIEKAILNFGLPMGPFRLLDEVGLDVACHVGPVLEEGLKNDRFKVQEGIFTMLKEGYLGKKNGKGFYTYDAKGKETGVNQAVIDRFLGRNFKSMTESTVVDRCVLLMVNEACYILSEGVANSPEDVDIGMIFGTGFAPFRGGLLQYADHRGIQNIVDTMLKLQDDTKDERYKPAQLLVDMAKGNKRFYPNRPFVPYQERTGFPKVNY